MYRFALFVYKHTKFKILMATSPRPPVHVDATPHTLAFHDTLTSYSFAVPCEGTQASNELLALVLAARVYDPRRSYLTDATVNLSLQKRSFTALFAKTVLASRNVSIQWISTKQNLADAPSRNRRFGWFFDPPSHRSINL